LAKKSHCSLNRVAMYLARQRGAECGVFQALSFSHKLRGCPGLKMGGYFVSTYACIVHQQRSEELEYRKNGGMARSQSPDTPTATAAASSPPTIKPEAAKATAAADSGVGKKLQHGSGGSATGAAAAAASPSSPARAASPARVLSRFHLYFGLDESGHGSPTLVLPVEYFPSSLLSVSDNVAQQDDAIQSWIMAEYAQRMRMAKSGQVRAAAKGQRSEPQTGAQTARAASNTATARRMPRTRASAASAAAAGAVHSEDESTGSAASEEEDETFAVGQDGPPPKRRRRSPRHTAAGAPAAGAPAATGATRLFKRSASAPSATAQPDVSQTQEDAAPLPLPPPQQPLHSPSLSGAPAAQQDGPRHQ
jgi:hypothetical protein